MRVERNDASESKGRWRRSPGERAARRSTSSGPRSPSGADAPPEKAHPPGERERRLRAFVTRMLADAKSAGLTLDEVIVALDAYRQGGG